MSSYNFKWDDKPFERNVLKRSSTSELWVGGDVMSKAQATRMNSGIVPEAQQAALKSAAAGRGAKQYDPSHWRRQPVGGRLAEESECSSSLGTSGSRKGAHLYESHVHEIIFGREQKEQGKQFELTEHQWLGHKKRVGKLNANMAEVDVVVFGHDQDYSTGIKEIETDLDQLPQFRNSAGMHSSEIKLNNVMQEKEPSLSLFTLFKNASHVDDAIFGDGIDNEAEKMIEGSPCYEGAAGIHSSAKSVAESSMCFGGRKGKRSTVIEQTSSSLDQSFQQPTKSSQDAFKQSCEFSGAAGAPLALMNPDGTYRHAVRRYIMPKEEMTADFAAATNANERNARAMPLPVLSREHTTGSIKAVVFSGAEPEGNREILGVPVLGENATLLEKREQSRREAAASGCRSQKYITQSEFNNAAGLASDELYFANTAELVRRIKPVTRKAGYSSVTDVDEVVFAHDLEGTDKDGASLVKDAAFYGAAGASSDDIHRTEQTLKTAPKHVPRMRDQTDNVVFGREMQIQPREVMGEALFVEMHRGAAGQSSAEMHHKSFDSRLDKYSSKEAGGCMPPNLLNNRHEPAGDLVGTLVRPQPRDYPVGYVGAIGASRDTLGRMETKSRYVQEDSDAPAPRRFRPEWDSSDIAEALKGHGGPSANSWTKNLVAAEGVAGKPSRMLNDQSVPFLLDDKDTEMERKYAKRNWSGANIKSMLSGEGYIIRDTLPAGCDTRKPPKGNLVDQGTMVDSIAKLNLLQPDLNIIDGFHDERADGGGVQGEAWTDGKTDYELYQYMKNFGQGPPYGSDPLSTYGKPDYTTGKERTENDMTEKLVQAYERAANYVEPETTEHGYRRKKFQPAILRGEFESTLKQRRLPNSTAARSPFGIEESASISYKTSSQEGLEAGLAAWGGVSNIDTSSMASRLARRRLERSNASPRAQQSMAMVSRP
mmetsp:Transcript_15141/g.36218  ORF Transcript_15141/g.36218 Transcript_15141/m.36218 type:complete len:937 (-) Transcript_15141:164-2974(-)